MKRIVTVIAFALILFSFSLPIEKASGSFNEADAFINQVKSDMEAKGWNNIDSKEGLFYDENWGSIIIEPTEEEKNLFMYTVWGRTEGKNDNPITVVAEGAFSEAFPEGKIYKLFYVSKAGRYLEADYEENGILQNDADELFDYMYSY